MEPNNPYHVTAKRILQPFDSVHRTFLILHLAALLFLLIWINKMATERAPLSSITNLQLQNRPFPTFNRLVQRDTCDLESCHNSTTRVMGAGKCNVVFSQFRGEKVVCPCQQGVFNYNGTSNVFDDTCQDCLHSAVQHESLSASKGGRLVSSPPLQIIESPLTSQFIQMTLLLKLPTGPHQ